MEKLYVNRETFEALTQAIKRNGVDGMMELHDEAPKGWNGDWDCLNELSVPQMAKALYVGYEVKPTPEEAILSYFKYNERDSKSNDRDVFPEAQAKVEAILFVLNHLGKEIEGINK